MNTALLILFFKKLSPTGGATPAEEFHCGRAGIARAYIGRAGTTVAYVGAAGLAKEFVGKAGTNPC